MPGQPISSQIERGVKIRIKQVEKLCQRAGFPLSDIRTEDEVLLLIPSRLDAVPEAETLRRLGRRLKNLGHEHVAFQLTGACETGDTRQP